MKVLVALGKSFGKLETRKNVIIVKRYRINRINVEKFNLIKQDVAVKDVAERDSSRQRESGKVGKLCRKQIEMLD